MKQLVRLHLRRDRWQLLAWVLFVGLLPTLMAVSTRQGYPDQATMDAFAQQSMANASEVALRGPVFAVSVGGLVAWTVASSGSLVSAVIAVLMAVRYVRSDEAAGRTELLRSQPVGRRDVLIAALAVPGGCAVAIGLVVFAGLAATGLPVAGSLLLGLVLMGSTLFFTGLGAVAAELSTSAGLARGLASIETDYVNGEIVLLGRTFGVPTPVNEAIVRSAHALAAKQRVGPFTPAELRRRIEQRA